MCVSRLFLLLFVSFRAGRYVTNSPAPLAYRDVFVLAHDYDLQDDVRDDRGNVTSPASGFVLALRQKEIPVCVLEMRGRAGDVAGWERRVADVAVARTDQVTVAHWRSVKGLERRLVAWLADWGRDEDDDVDFRLHAWSRCTTQLILVGRPSEDSHTETSHITHHSHASSEGDAGEEEETTT